MVGFRFFDQDVPTRPLTAFYDWLYVRALRQNPDESEQLRGYRGFTDIAFNPARSLNCQARSAALYVALGGSVPVETWQAFFERVRGTSAEPPA
ncbi:MAG: hypothetical protein AB1758_23580 [Candidatus Eremiobacterota bacterium]